MTQKSDLLHYFQLIHQEICKVVEELPEDAVHWRPNDEFNTIAVLLQHLMGAEKYWIWEAIGGGAIERDRAGEFVDRPETTKESILQAYRAVRETSLQILSDMEDADLEKDCIIVNPDNAKRLLLEGNQSKRWAIIRHIQHQALHLGHIHMIRRLYRQQSV